MARDASESFARRRWQERYRRTRRYLIAAGVVVVVGVLVWVVLFSSLLGAHTTEVKGVESFGEDDVLAAAGIEDGEPLARLDIGGIEDRVGDLPRVASVSVSRTWPRKVTIEVTERVAVAVAEEDGKLRGMDETGTLFRSYEKQPKTLPLVRLGAIDDARSDALTEVALVVASLDDSIAAKVDHVTVASMDSIELVLSNGDEVQWGSSADSEQKAKVLSSLLTIPASGYDVSAPDRPTTRS